MGELNHEIHEKHEISGSGFHSKLRTSNSKLTTGETFDRPWHNARWKEELRNPNRDRSNVRISCVLGFRRKRPKFQKEPNMYDASRGTFRVACLLFVFLQGAWSCLFWNMNLKGTPLFFSAPRVSTHEVKQA